MKSTIARTGAGEDRDGDSPGEDRDGDSPGEDRDGDSPEDRDGDSPEDRDGDSPGEDCDGDSPKYSSSEEARDELRRIGEGESPEANRRRWPVRSLEANRLRERSSEMPRS